MRFLFLIMQIIGFIIVMLGNEIYNKRACLKWAKHSEAIMVFGFIVFLVASILILL